MSEIKAVTNNPLVVCLAVWIQQGFPKAPKAAVQLLTSAIKKDPTLVKQATKLIYGTADLNEASYKAKYGESFADTLKAVSKGNVKKAAQLIIWNKYFLSVEEVMRLIIFSEIQGNKAALNTISAAVKKVRRKPRLKHWMVIGLLRYLALNDKTLDQNALLEIAVMFRSELDKMDWPADDPIMDILYDKNEIAKLIRLHKDLIFN